MLFIKIEYKKKTWHVYSTYRCNLLETVFVYIEQSLTQLQNMLQTKFKTQQIEQKKLKLSVNRFISLSNKVPQHTVSKHYYKGMSIDLTASQDHMHF